MHRLTPEGDQMVLGVMRNLLACAMIVASVVTIAGCDNAAEDNAAPSGNGAPAAQTTEAKKPAATQPLVPVVQAIDWCKEHGMAESTCAQCNSEVAAALKAKGDWCKEHSKPESQCFECHPELKETFVADFKKKHGKEPPAMAETVR